MFPYYLKDIEHLKTNKMISFKEEIVGGKEVVIVCYNVMDEKMWNEPFSMECRGITYLNGECICSPFGKIFNINERESTLEKDVIPKIKYVSNKIDGTMVTPVLIDSSIYFKTKKTFYSDITREVTKNTPYNVLSFSKFILEKGYTPIFEYTSSTNRIVVDYGNDVIFTLLAIRNNKDGSYKDYNCVHTLCDLYNINMVEYPSYSIEEIKDIIDTGKNFEGFVLELYDGSRVKWKTRWYLSLHRINTVISERNIAEMIVDETIDDMKSLLVSMNISIKPIEDIEERVIYDLTQLKIMVDDIIDRFKNMDIKETATSLKNEPLFSLVMSEKKGKDADYKKYWKKHYLKNYSIRCVYNANF